MKIRFLIYEGRPSLYREIKGEKRVYNQEAPDAYVGVWIDDIIKERHLTEDEDAILRDGLIIAHEQYRLYMLLLPLIPTLNQYL